MHGVLHEPIYMEQPSGFINAQFPDYVCRLHKALYGLKHASQALFHRLISFVTTNGFQCRWVDLS